MKKKILFLFVMLLAVAVTVSFAAEVKYKAKLTGKGFATPVETKASGNVSVEPEKGETALEYRLHVKDINDVMGAHIHLGKPGQEGPPVLTLWTGEKKGKFSGTLAKGKATDKDLMGPMQGKTIADLVNEIKAGNAYVNVHTAEHPDGEIRGELTPKKGILK